MLKLSPISGVGNSFAHVGAQRVIDAEGMWVKELDKYESFVLTNDADERLLSIDESQCCAWRR